MQHFVQFLVEKWQYPFPIKAIFAYFLVNLSYFTSIFNYRYLDLIFGQELDFFEMGRRPARW